MYERNDVPGTIAAVQKFISGLTPFSFLLCPPRYTKDKPRQEAYRDENIDYDRLLYAHDKRRRHINSKSGDPASQSGT